MTEYIGTQWCWAVCRDERFQIEERNAPFDSFIARKLSASGVLGSYFEITRTALEDGCERLDPIAVTGKEPNPMPLVIGFEWAGKRAPLS